MLSAQKDKNIGILLALFVAVTLAAAGGLLAGSGDVTLAILAAGSAIGVVLLSRPTVALWVVVFSSLVLAGLTQLYLPQLQFIRWTVGLLAWALGVVALLRYMFTTSAPGSSKLPTVWWWMVAFAGVALLSGALNFSNTETLLFGLKGHFQMSGLFVAIIMMRWSEDVIDKFPRVIVGIALVQLPFVLHQYLFLVPGRLGLGGGVVAEDVVSGTMGATVGGGGANAVLSILLIIAAAIVLANYKRGLISPLKMCLNLLVLMLPIAFNSNRIALLYLLLVYLLLFSADIFKAQLKAIFVTTLFVLTLASVSWSYMNLASTADTSLGWRGFVSQTIARNTDEGHGYGRFQLNRWTGLTFWVREHRDATWDKILAGHGVGSSREGEGGAMSPTTLAQQRYPGVGIGLTSVSAILWDAGIIGLACWLAILWSAYLAAGRLARHYVTVPSRAAALHGFQVAIPILFISLFHKSFLTFHVPYQSLVLLVLGYIGYWQMKAWADVATKQKD